MAKKKASKAPATRSPAKKAPATRSPAKKAPATRSPATKALAKKAPAKRRSSREATALKREELYPYVATHASTWELGHGAFVDLVVDRGAVVSNLSPAELEAAGLDLIEAREVAIANLAAEIGQVEAQVYEAPEGFPFLVWDAHWLAASSLLLPGLHAFAAQQLDTDRLLASIPHRDALLIFPEGDADTRAAMARMIAENEGQGDAPITAEFFALLPDRVLPWSERPRSEGKRGKSAPPRWFTE